MVVTACPALHQQSSSGAGLPLLPWGAVVQSSNASLFLWEEVLEARLTAAAQAFAPSVLPRHPGRRKGLSPWTLMSGVSRSVALRLKAVSADGSLHLTGAQPSSLILRACPACPLPLLPIISTSSSELHSTLPQKRQEPCCSEWETFLPGSGRPHIMLEIEQMSSLGRGVRCRESCASGQVPASPSRAPRPHGKGCRLCGYWGAACGPCGQE